jgi:hypothetical protein
MSKFKTIAVLLAALGMSTVAYKYFKDDFDFTLGLEEEDEDV